MIGLRFDQSLAAMITTDVNYSYVLVKFMTAKLYFMIILTLLA